MKKLSLTNLSNNKRYLIIAISLVLIIVFTLGLAALGGVFDKQDTQTLKDTGSKTTSDAPSAQSDFNDGGARDPSPSSPKGEASITDNNGNIDTTPPQSQWQTSPSGDLTVYTPAKNGLLTSERSALSGKSTQPKVSYRLIDNVSGVIAQGELSVTSGSYSGTFTFSTSATQGRLDVFNTQMDGVEYNNIEIPVRF